MKKVTTKKAPQAIGPYSQAIVANGFVFCSGQIGINPKTNTLPKGIKQQTKQALLNISEVVKAAGSSPDKIVKTTVYLKNIADFSEMNTMYASFFLNQAPARSTIAIARS